MEKSDKDPGRGMAYAIDLSGGKIRVRWRFVLLVIGISFAVGAILFVASVPISWALADAVRPVMAQLRQQHPAAYAMVVLFTIMLGPAVLFGIQSHFDPLVRMVQRGK